MVEGPGEEWPGREEPRVLPPPPKEKPRRPKKRGRPSEAVKNDKGRRGRWRWCRGQWRGRGETGRGGRRPRPMEEEPWMPPWPPKKKPRQAAERRSGNGRGSGGSRGRGMDGGCGCDG